MKILPLFSSAKIGDHLRLLFLLLILLGSSGAAPAHDPGLSSATVDLATREILIEVTFAPADLHTLDAKSFADLAPGSIALLADGKIIAPLSLQTRELGADNFEFTARYPRPQGEAQFRSPLLARLPFGHRQAFTLRDEAGATVRTAIFSATHDSANLPARTQPTGAQPRSRILLVVPALIVAGLLGFAITRARRAATAAA